MTRCRVWLINCLLVVAVLVAVNHVDGHRNYKRSRRSESGSDAADTARYDSSKEAAAAAVRDRVCVLTNRTGSVESNVTQYHCEMQDMRSEELAFELLQALKIDRFPNSSTIESCRQKETMKRVLEREGFLPDGTPRKARSAGIRGGGGEDDDDSGGGECGRLNYVEGKSKSGCPGPTCDRPLVTTHRVLQSGRGDHDLGICLHILLLGIFALYHHVFLPTAEYALLSSCLKVLFQIRPPTIAIAPTSTCAI